MPKKLSDEDYIASLPRKIAGTAVLFRNEADELLVVKPDYRDDWLVPGGCIDEGEDPLSCAIRETKEEIDLTVSELQLVGICFKRGNSSHPDAIKFIYDGGVLSPDSIAKIHLQEDELLEYRFVSIEKALTLLSGSLQASLKPCLTALESGAVAHVVR